MGFYSLKHAQQAAGTARKLRKKVPCSLSFHRTIANVSTRAHRVNRNQYRFGRTLGAGTYGIVREADCPVGKVAVKIILKRNVRGNEQMVYDELELLQALNHPNIVHFRDWFESRVCRPSSVGEWAIDRV